MANYRVIELQPSDGFTDSEAVCINAFGLVGGVVRSSGSLAALPQRQGATWQDSSPAIPGSSVVSMEPLTVMTALNSSVNALNDQGDTVGGFGSDAQTINQRPFLVAQGIFQELPPNADGSEATGINNSGIVVGSESGLPSVGFVFDTASKKSVFFQGQTFLGINAAGLATGLHDASPTKENASILRDGVIVNLGPASNAMDINDEGIVVGASASGIPAQWDTRVISPPAQFFALLDGSVGGIAFAVNSRGDAVGSCESSTQGIASLTATLFSGGVSSDLNALIPAGSGWHLSRASGINDAGQIVGSGELNRQRRGFLLVPTGPAVAGTIAGKVSDRKGNGLHGASVSFFSAALSSFPGDTLVESTVTGGSYATPVVPAGSYGVTVALSGFVTAIASVTVDRPVTILNFVLAREGILTGHVRDTAGNGLAEVTLNLGSVVAVARTDAAGFYSFSLAPGSYGGTVTLPSFTPDTFSAAILDGATVTRDFVLVKPLAGTLTGIVTDDGSVPLLGVKVSADGKAVRTDGSGRYTLPALAPGPVTVTVNGGVRFLTQVDTVNVTPGETTHFNFALVGRAHL